jgi:hypothetical protein
MYKRDKKKVNSEDNQYKINHKTVVHQFKVHEVI